MSQKTHPQSIDPKYLTTLEDETMGFHHMNGPINPTNLDANRGHCTAPWMPKESLKDLWKCICNRQLFAVAGSKTITDATGMCLMLTMFKNTGVFHSAIDKWKDKPAA